MDPRPDVFWGARVNDVVMQQIVKEGKIPEAQLA